ncbi:MAG: Maf family protein [Candidatus Lernaella stagnicola]|nr:Maf family protein [Candidatus Lernaella stagnicola]
MSEARLILASASPRRRDLITQLGIDFEVCVSGVPEEQLPGETPGDHTRRLAREKAAAVAAKYPSRWVLGADTAVVVDDAILGKPRDAAEAVAMLRLISGRWHIVFTGFCLMHLEQGREYVDVAMSDVFIRLLSDAQIRAYVATGEPMDKAGAYAIQGIGAGLVQQVKGSYTNVVGLPLAEVAMLWETIYGEDILVKGKP